MTRRVALRPGSRLLRVALERRARQDLAPRRPRSSASSGGCARELAGLDARTLRVVAREVRVSTTTPRTTPGSPRRTMHQSWPGARRRRVSQPSIHLPRSVYLPAMKTARPRLEQVLLRGEELVVRPEHGAPEALGGRGRRDC